MHSSLQADCFTNCELWGCVLSWECVHTHVTTFSTVPLAQVNSEVEYSVECVSTQVTTFSTVLLAWVNSDVVYSVWTCLQDYQIASMLCVLFHVNFEVAWVRIPPPLPLPPPYPLQFFLFCLFLPHFCYRPPPPPAATPPPLAQSNFFYPHLHLHRVFFTPIFTQVGGVEEEKEKKEKKSICWPMVLYFSHMHCAWIALLLSLHGYSLVLSDWHRQTPMWPGRKLILTLHCTVWHHVLRVANVAVHFPRQRYLDIIVFRLIFVKLFHQPRCSQNVSYSSGKTVGKWRLNVRRTRRVWCKELGKI